MSITTTVPREDSDAERWREWQLGNAKSSRRSAIHARIVITVVFTGLLAWLGLLLSSPV